MIKNKTLQKIWTVILSYLTTIVFSLLANFRITGRDILLPIVFAGVCVIIYQGEKLYQKKNMVPSLALSIIISLTAVVGAKMDMDAGTFADWSMKDPIFICILAAFFFYGCMILFHCLDKGFLLYEKEYTWKHPRLWLTGIFLLAWMPYFLTFFPGNMGPDTFESLNMILGNIPVTNHHPVFFTFLLFLVVKGTAFLGSLQISLAIFSLIQMVILALTLSDTILWLKKRHASRYLRIIAILFFAFHPFVPMYSMYLTKDVLFSVVLLLLSLKLMDMVMSDGTKFQSKKECVKLFSLILLSILLRNNGLYIAVVLSVILLIRFRKYWKNILVGVMSVFALTAIYMGPVFHTLGIEKESFAESMSIPLQQVGYVIVNDGVMSEEDAMYLQKLMPFEKVKEVFEPGYTDMYKFDKDFNDVFLNETKSQFLSVWGRLCTKNFSDYIKAYLMQTAGYWHYGETNTVSTIGVAENNLGVEQFDVVKITIGFSLQAIMEKLLLVFRKAPVICFLSSMAIEIFAVLLCIVQDIRNKRKTRVIAWMPFLLLWGTVMIAAPAYCLFRYLFPLFLAWPVMITNVLDKSA